VKFYHYSKERFSVLIPQYGLTRHEGEDDTAINQPVIWLTDGENDQTYINKVMTISIDIKSRYNRTIQIYS
jgi:hypothetical protein